MTEVDTIFDGVTATDEIIESDQFSNADFLFFETPNLEQNEGYELAVSLSVKITENLPIGSVDFGSREIPINFPNNVADTQVIIPIPREVSQTELESKILLITTQEIRLVIYAVTSQVLSKELLEKLEALQDTANTNKNLNQTNVALNTTNVAVDSFELGIDLIGLLIPALPLPLPSLPLPLPALPK